MGTKYNPHFKQKAINLALYNGQTYRQTADDLGIKYPTCVIGYNKP
ncbi:transposase [Entomomonas moraniae]|uniref:Transposase n=1 Tax=Entomomonas moraniae TaxID=2213226 RepID=A0A3Q9JHV1_9GAMM|nr:transposase [Entomomonas moraniae]